MDTVGNGSTALGNREVLFCRCCFKTSPSNSSSSCTDKQQRDFKNEFTSPNHRSSPA